jgi:hypothetical protein
LRFAAKDGLIKHWRDDFRRYLANRSGRTGRCNKDSLQKSRLR